MWNTFHICSLWSQLAGHLPNMSWTGKEDVAHRYCPQFGVGDSDIKIKILWAMKENSGLIMGKSRSCIN